jgi:inosine-uridine nucleoside N-ribohydrolase
VGALLAGGHAVATSRWPVILDVDTGVDDALALALACRLPVLEIIGVTTVAGNVDQRQATDNTRRVLHFLGARDVPVASGMTAPLVRPHRDAADFHGPNGLGGLELPAATGESARVRAPEFIIQAAHEHRGELVLICLAPLTNLAVALLLEPELPELLHRVAVMGGAFTVAGNVTQFAEFNVFVDPEAAAIVARSALPLTFVGLDVTTRVRLTSEEWERWRGLGHPEARLVVGVSTWIFEHRRLESYALHDPLAVAAVAEPSVVGLESAAVTIDTGLSRTLGQTRLVRAGDGEQEHLIALDVDVECFRALFSETLGLPV